MTTTDTPDQAQENKPRSVDPALSKTAQSINTGDKSTESSPVKTAQANDLATEAPQTEVLQVVLAVPLGKALDYLPPAGFRAANCPVGARVKVSLQRQQLVGFIVGHAPRNPNAPYQLKPAQKLIDSSPLLPAMLWKVATWAANYYQHPLGDVLHQFIPKTLREGGDRHATRTHYSTTIHDLTPCTTILKNAPKQLAALEHLSTHSPAADTSLKRKGITQATLNALIKKGLVAKTEAPRWQDSAHDSHAHSLLAEPTLALNDEQTKALAQITDIEQYHCCLLDGVTGSGKTEVYLQAIAHTLHRGKQALVLVPEINLTPQTLERFKRRFNVPIAAYHSQLNEPEKFDAWLQASSGHARIVIGTRSTTLIPLKAPGLIIVDEEHDASFKQQDGFRYHARDTAIYRAHQEDIPIILGSATPALETLNNALSGRYLHLRLLQRPTGHPPPKLECIDIRGQKLDTGLSQPVIQAIKETLEQKQQALVFLNRRGFAPVVLCHNCGQCLDCNHCSAHLTWHRQKNQLKCHHCLESQPLPKSCPVCGSNKLNVLGQGTERVETTLQEIFTSTPVIRVDRDTTSRKSAIDKLRSRIAQGDPVILVGTQMLSKGHHFPKVTLSVILDGDTGLLSVDYRGTERLAQLITQVAGRSGRGEHPGRVLIQTLQPDHPALQHLQHGGYAGFAQATLTERAQAGMPPFGHLALIRAEAQETTLAEEFLRQLKQVVCASPPEQHVGATLAMGPVAAPLTRRAGYHRQQLLLQTDDRRSLHHTLYRLRLAANTLGYPSSRLRWSIDVDPIDLY
jgi:primosomal protein N' (replication factor Y)